MRGFANVNGSFMREFANVNGCDNF